MPDYLPTKELDLQAWVNNFITVASPSLPALGLTTADLAVVTNAATDFGNALSDVDTSKAAYEGALKTKNAAIKTLDKDTRALVKRIQGHAGVSDSLKAQLGITIRNPIVNRTPPVAPATLVATPNADGTNTLKWHKAGNKATTQFVVLAKPLTSGMSVSSDTGWTMVGQTTKGRFEHQGVTPGVPMAYKVLAARAGFVSPASLPATVYAS